MKEKDLKKAVGLCYNSHRQLLSFDRQLQRIREHYAELGREVREDRAISSSGGVGDGKYHEVFVHMTDGSTERFLVKLW